MKIIPVTFAYAKQFIKEHHRHNPNVVGCKFCIGLENMGGGTWCCGMWKTCEQISG